MAVKPDGLLLRLYQQPYFEWNKEADFDFISSWPRLELVDVDCRLKTFDLGTSIVDRGPIEL